MQIKSSNDCYQAFKLFYDQDTIELTESFIALYLNRANNTLGWLKVSQGGITGTVADTRIILATALKIAATGIIISHNHPSGQLNPSDADIELTKKLKQSAAIMDISVLDHIIYTVSGYYSFADEGLM
jgi:DNA repair protein RadC